MQSSPLRCLITAGPTREFFDPVRFVTNPSSGKMGYAIAAAAADQGWAVDLVSGPVTLPAPAGVNRVSVITSEQMLAAAKSLFPSCDLLIMSAAVCDMRPKTVFSEKVKKAAIEWTIEMEATVDILKTLSAERRPEQVLCGFAAETNDIEAYARKKLLDKNLDWIVANKVGGTESAFESDSNFIQVIGKNGAVELMGPNSKTEIGRQLIRFLAHQHGW